MKVIGIYPNGINNTVVQSGWGRNLKVKRQFCYGDGFPHYNIDGRFYWYYDEEQVYHIEDSKTRKIVYIAIARNPQEVIDEFLKIKGELIVIETALKEGNQAQRELTNLKKSLLKGDITNKWINDYSNQKNKKLKALEIIKTGINEYCKKEKDWTNRNYYELQLLLTDEEYDLLKEELL